MDIHAVERTGLFSGLSGEARVQAMAVLKYYEFGPEEVLLEEGEPDRSMLFIVEGELEVSLGGVALARVGAGELCGEMALFGSFDRRSATVTSIRPTKVLVVDEEGLRYLRLGDNPLARSLETLSLRTIASRLRATDHRIAARATGEPIGRSGRQGLIGKLANVLGMSGEVPRTAPPRLLDVLRATHGFAGRDEQILQGVAARLELVAAATGDTLVQEGQPGDHAYIVAEGRIGVYCNVRGDRAERVATLGPGHVFGVVALTDTDARSATCRALEPAYLVRIRGDVYRQLEAENTPEGRAFRRGMIDALSVQLRLANEHLLSLETRGEGR